MRLFSWLALRRVRAFSLLVGFAGAALADPAPLRVSDRGRELVDAAGQPVFLLADTAWSLALRVDRAEAEEYLQRRKTQGFNAVAFVLFAPGRTELTDRPGNFYGAVPFEASSGGLDPTKPLTTPGADPAKATAYDYWDHVDYLVALTRTLGFQAILLPTWGSGVVGSYDGKNPSEVVFDAAKARTYGAWLARRYGAEPHVIWMLGGDRSAVNGERDYRPVFRALAEGLREAPQRQLMSYHPRKAAPQSAEWFHADEWLAFNSNQDWPEKQVAHMADDWARTPPKPTWLFEGRYEGYWRGGAKSADWGEWQVRQQAYQTVFAGAFGHTYGHERVFGFGHDGVKWKEFLDTHGARSMTNLALLMRSFTPGEFGSRVPDQSLIDGEPGKPGRLESDAIVALRTAARRKAVFYTANGRPVRARLEQLHPDVRYAHWFDPRRGGWLHSSAVRDYLVAFAQDVKAGPGAAVREFVPPTHGAGQDWVLMLSAGAEP